MIQLEIATVLETGALAQDEKQRAAQLYLASISKSERRAHGRVYTPVHLVNFILSLAGYDAAQELEHVRVLDPACGGGAFLVGAALRIAERLRQLGARLHTARGAQRFLRTCERNLFGVDVDQEACDLSRAAVRAVASELVAPQPVAESFFARNVLECDFLLGQDVDSVRGETGFDLIMGNPPYVPTTRLSVNAKDQYRARFQTANGRIDLYVLFFERSLEFLSGRGRLAFITPNKFLTSLSATPLRKLLRQSASVCKIAEFDSHKVFAGAATIPCITVVDREHNTTATTYLECSASEDVIEVRHQSRHRLPPNEWRLGAPQILELLERLRGSHPPLSSYVTRISAGIATGHDRTFVVPTEEADRLGLELALRRPAVRGKDVQPGNFHASGSDVIVPYVSSHNGVPELVDIARYPATHAYLSGHRSDLERRHCVRTWGKQWYDIHDPWSFDIAATPKIIVPDVAFSNRFAADAGNLCPLHSVYYLIPADPADIDYLTAVLNSGVIEFCIRATAPIVKDGFVRYRKQFLQPLPIPRCNSHRRSALGLTAGDQEHWGQMIAGLFGLTELEMKLMRSYVRESRDNHAPNVGAR
jgi:adenine-specific DNA-methyltransferase